MFGRISAKKNKADLMRTATVISFVVNFRFKPRTWCSFCPMGAMPQMICKIKAKKLIVKHLTGALFRVRCFLDLVLQCMI